MNDPIKAAADWLSDESPEKWGFYENMLFDVVEAAEHLQASVASLTEAHSTAISVIGREGQKRVAAEVERDRLMEVMKKVRNEAHGVEWQFESGFHAWVYDTIDAALSTQEEADDKA